MKIVDDNKNYFAYKSYDTELGEEARKERCQKEVNFLRYLTDIGSTNTPVLVDTDNKGWVVMSWIEGESVSYLDEKDAISISEFLIRINELNESKKIVSHATDGLTSLNDYIKGIEERAKYIFSKIEIEGRDRERLSIVKKEYINGMQEAMKRVKTIKNKECWDVTKIGGHITSSDIGVHNMLKKDGEMYFLDFEYAGFDDISKSICDLVIHPEHIMTKECESKLMGKLAERQDLFGGDWVQRKEDMMPLARLRWILIMLKNFNKGRENEDYFEKIVDYAKNTRDRISHG